MLEMDKRLHTKTDLDVMYTKNFSCSETKDKVSCYQRNNDALAETRWVSSILCPVDEPNLPQWTLLDYDGFSLHYYRPLSPKQFDPKAGNQGIRLVDTSWARTPRRGNDILFDSRGRVSARKSSLNTARGSRRWSLTCPSSKRHREPPRKKQPHSARGLSFVQARPIGLSPEKDSVLRRLTEYCDHQTDGGLLVKVMQKRNSLKGTSRVTLSSLLSDKRRHSLAECYILRFDPKIPWRKLKLWVRIRGILGSLHEKVIDEVIRDPSSPFYMQRDEDTGPVGINKNHYVFFDPSDYKANRQMRTSQEVKRILTLPPARRSKEEIHCAMIGLRGISAVAEYPVRMQSYLAAYGTFESYNPKRMIVKQGRPPEAFYYILYGRVLVAVRDDITGKVEVKCYLHRGHAFGELAIIKSSCRLSTVITKNYSELLCLSSEVFQKYFMVGGVKNMNDPDQTNFVRSLSFLKGWPIGFILENTNHETVTFGYFKRGSVLAKDSNFSDWLIIVKSGSLKVLKKLIKVRLKVSKKTGLPNVEAKSSGYLCFMRNNEEYTRHLHQNKKVLPPPLDTEGEHNEPDNIDNDIETVAMLNRPHTTVTGQRSSAEHSRGIVSASGHTRSTAKMVEFKSDNQLLKMKKTENKTMTSPRLLKVRSLSRDYDDDDKLEFEEKRTFLDDIDSAYNARAHIRTEADLNPQFVFVQTLTKGDVFGLAQCLFCDQPSLCVVSNGADCLLLNKKFYLDKCTTELIRRLRVEVSPYPSEEKFQEDLVTRIGWDLYKSALMKNIYQKRGQKISRMSY